MKALLHPLTFERLWRELDEREKAQPNPDLWHTTVWLECSGEFLELELVDATSARDSELGIELAEFDCPRCGVRHQSLRFR